MEALQLSHKFVWEPVALPYLGIFLTPSLHTYILKITLHFINI